MSACNQPTCRRARVPHYAYCPDHLERVIAAWVTASTRAPETNPVRVPSRTLALEMRHGAR